MRSIVHRFNERPQEYDGMLKKIGYQGPSLVAEFLSRHLKANAKILDVGCGSGLGGVELRKRMKRSTLVGADFSVGMLKEAKAKEVYDRLHVADLKKGLPFRSGSFSAVTCVGVFEYFSALGPPLKELARVSQRYVAFYVPVTPSKGYQHHHMPKVFRALVKAELIPIEVFAFTAWLDVAAFGVVAEKYGSRSAKAKRQIACRLFQAVPKPHPL